MAVVLRLMRAGAKKRPFYRMVAADSRRQRDGRFLQILGHYDPIAKPFTLVVDQEKVSKWLVNGAQPSEQVASLLRRVGMNPHPSVARKAHTAAAMAAAPAEAASKPAKAAKKKAAKKSVAKKRAVKRTPSSRKTDKKAKKKAAKKSAKK